jgi:hypothetical protein
MPNTQKPVAPTSKQTSVEVSQGNFSSDKCDLNDMGKPKDRDQTKQGVKRCC